MSSGGSIYSFCVAAQHSKNAKKLSKMRINRIKSNKTMYQGSGFIGSVAPPPKKNPKKVEKKHVF